MGRQGPAHPEDDERAPGGEAQGSAYRVGRVLALSDGVFAIAMTLLVLNIAVPNLGPNPPPQEGLHAVAVDVIPRVVTFAVSFFLAGMYWMIHHRTFEHIRRVDQPLLWLNLAALMLVCLFPFSTSFTMRYHVLGAVEVYYGNLLLAGLAFLAVGIYAVRRDLIPVREQVRARAGRFRNVAALVVFAAAMVIAVWNVSVAQQAWIAILPAILLARRFVPGGK